MEFTYREYVSMLDELKQAGYIFTDYENYLKYSRCVILRHDVDYSLEKALELAELEARENVFSTYMILVSSGFYNLLNYKTRNMLQRIVNLGHNLGLHFDEANYENLDINSFKKHVMEEMQILRDQVRETNITVVSMHRPSEKCLEAELDFSQDGLINSYGNTFFKEFKYVSDSRMCWREPVMDYIKKGEYDRLHILTHPFWYSREKEDIKSKLHHFLEQAQKDRYCLLNQNFRNLQEFVSDDSGNTST